MWWLLYNILINIIKIVIPTPFSVNIRQYIYHIVGNFLKGKNFLKLDVQSYFRNNILKIEGRVT